MSTFSGCECKGPIKYKIECDRIKLLQLAARKGMRDHEVIKESQYLDRLLNEYYAQQD